MASHTVDNAMRVMRQDAPTCTRVLLAALHTQETTLLDWLTAEDDTAKPEWKAKYDLWQATRTMIVQLGGTTTP